MSVFDATVDTSNTKESKIGSNAAALQMALKNIGSASTAATGSKAATAGTSVNKTTSELDGASAGNIRDTIAALGKSSTTALAKDRAGNVDSIVGNLIASGEATARREHERTVLPRLQAVGQAAGSELNSTVQLLRNQADEDLAARLMEVRGRLGFEGRKMATDEITSAAQVEQGAAQTAGSLAQILANANRQTTTETAQSQEQQQTQQQVQQQLQTLMDLGLERKDIEELVKSEGNQTSNGGLLAIIDSIGGLIGNVTGGLPA